MLPVRSVSATGETCENWGGWGERGGMHQYLQAWGTIPRKYQGATIFPERPVACIRLFLEPTKRIRHMGKIVRESASFALDTHSPRLAASKRYKELLPTHPASHLLIHPPPIISIPRDSHHPFPSHDNWNPKLPRAHHRGHLDLLTPSYIILLVADKQTQHGRRGSDCHR
jgi:hypothetical protein